MDEKETRPWEPYIPTYVDMYYVDYRDDLSDNTKLLQDCIDKNSLYPISEYLDDWWDVISYTDSSLNTNRATFNEAREYAKRYL